MMWRFVARKQRGQNKSHSRQIGGVCSFEGAVGGSGLSTIAIYNAGQDKTVVYLHSDPVDSLKVGDSVDRGQVIAHESWRGISSSSAAHTHVEMRLGRQTHAAVSVGDPDLTNPIPTTFWMDRGYNIGVS